MRIKAALVERNHHLWNVLQSIIYCLLFVDTLLTERAPSICLKPLNHIEVITFIKEACNLDLWLCIMGEINSRNGSKRNTQNGRSVELRMGLT